MAVHNARALYDWWEREHPSPEVWRRVWEWVFVDLNERGWAWPSWPDGTPTPEPPYVERRTAIVFGTSVVVSYLHEIETGRVDLLDVTGTD